MKINFFLPTVANMDITHKSERKFMFGLKSFYEKWDLIFFFYTSRELKRIDYYFLMT